jgi:hypothetical protein
MRGEVGRVSLVGFPPAKLGRIGLAMYPTNPEILYAVIENENPVDGVTSRGGFGEVYRTQNGGRAWTQVSGDFNVSPKGPYYFSQIFVNPKNDQSIYVTQDGIFHSRDGGKTWNDPPRLFPRMFGDVRTLWIDPQNPNRMIQGSDGSIAASYDGGITSDAFSNIPVGENYKSSSMWKSRTTSTPVCRTTNIGRVRPTSRRAARRCTTGSRWAAATEFTWCRTQRTADTCTRRVSTASTSGSIRSSATASTSLRVATRLACLHIDSSGKHPSIYRRTTAKRFTRARRMLLRSTDRGEHWTEISPDLSTNPADKILPSSEGGVPGGIPWFAISSISESPKTAA